MERQPLYSYGQERRVWNAGLNGMNRSIANAGIAEYELSRKIPVKPFDVSIWSDLGDALLRSQNTVIVEPAEASTLKEDTAVKIAFGINRQPVQRKQIRCADT